MFVTIVRDTILARSHFAFFLRSKVIRRFRGAANAAQHLGLATYGGLGVRNFDLDREWAVIQEAISQNQRACANSATAYGLAILKSPPETKSGPLAGTQLVVDEPGQIAKLVAFAEESGIPHYDLNRKYTELGDADQQIYVHGIGHFTDYGHGLTAEVLVPYVEDLLDEREGI